MPTLITGKPGIVATLVGGAATMFVVLYVAHGISTRMPAALTGTSLGPVIVVGLGVLSAEFARLSGLADENEYDLAQLLPGTSFRELSMAGIIVDGLGVLNNVAITQSLVVRKLRAAAPKMSREKLFAAGIRIGCDHVVSIIYTIVPAYAGDSTAVLLLLYFTDRPATVPLNVEMFAGEVARTLGSAVGLVLNVLITTSIVALTIASFEPELRGRHAVGVDAE